MGQVDVHFFPGPNEKTYKAKEFLPPKMGRDVDTTEALDRFAKLSSPEGVLNFVRRYGVLGLCKHRLPATHNPRFLRKPFFGAD